MEANNFYVPYSPPNPNGVYVNYMNNIQQGMINGYYQPQQINYYGDYQQPYYGPSINMYGQQPVYGYPQYGYQQNIYQSPVRTYDRYDNNAHNIYGINTFNSQYHGGYKTPLMRDQETKNRRDTLRMQIKLINGFKGIKQTPEEIEARIDSVIYPNGNPMSKSEKEFQNDIEWKVMVNMSKSEIDPLSAMTQENIRRANMLRFIGSIDNAFGNHNLYTFIAQDIPKIEWNNWVIDNTCNNMNGMGANNLRQTYDYKSYNDLLMAHARIEKETPRNPYEKEVRNENFIYEKFNGETEEEPSYDISETIGDSINELVKAANETKKNLAFYRQGLKQIAKYYDSPEGQNATLERREAYVGELIESLRRDNERRAMKAGG